MSNATLLLLVLDNFSGFDAINAIARPLPENKSEFRHIKRTSNVEKCDPIAVNSILKKIEEIPTNNLMGILPQDVVLMDLNEVFDYPFGYVNNKSNFQNTSNRTFVNKLTKFHESDNNKAHNYSNQNSKSNPSEFGRGAVNLVAIFETLSNITAQTCGATLLSSNWALTSASCVGVLHLYYNNSYSIQNNSNYTIVANAANPLIDGTVHNVTEIVFNPTNVNLKNIWLPPETYDVPTLAALRITPRINVKPLPIMDKEVKEGIVSIYGWSLEKNGTGLDITAPTTFTAQIVEPRKCNTDNNLITAHSVICLSVHNHNNLNLNQMNPGGPVLSTYNKQTYLLGVVQSIQNSLVTVCPTFMHSSWIKNLSKLN